MRGPSAVIAIVCSQWAARVAVGRRDRPAVRADPRLVAAEREHRLDGEAQAGLEPAAAAAGAVVRDLRLLVHLGADAVADVGAHDAVAARDADVLDRRSDVLERVARHRRGDAREHRRAGVVDELPRPRPGVPDDPGPRGVAVPAVDDGARVDRDELALADAPRVGDAVDDLVVDRDAERVAERREVARARR